MIDLGVPIGEGRCTGIYRRFDSLHESVKLNESILPLPPNCSLACTRHCRLNAKPDAADGWDDDFDDDWEEDSSLSQQQTGKGGQGVKA